MNAWIDSAHGMNALNGRMDGRKHSGRDGRKN